MRKNSGDRDGVETQPEMGYKDGETEAEREIINPLECFAMQFGGSKVKSHFTMFSN